MIDAPALRAAIPGSLVRRRNGYLSRAAQTLLDVLRAGAPGHARWPPRARPAASARALQWRSPTGV